MHRLSRRDVRRQDVPRTYGNNREARLATVLQVRCIIKCDRMISIDVSKYRPTVIVRLAVDMDIHGYIHGYYAGTTL